MKVSAMFPSRYVSGKHLAGPALVEVINVKAERMRAGPDKPEDDAYVMSFRQIAGPAITGAECKGGVFALVLRGGLATDLAGVLGDDTDGWRNHRAVIYPQPMTVAGKNVIAMKARAPKPAPLPSQAATTEGQQAPTP
jgi:hypothetical protein